MLTRVVSSFLMEDDKNYEQCVMQFVYAKVVSGSIVAVVVTSGGSA